jgi:hypothetical protein
MHNVRLTHISLISVYVHEDVTFTHTYTHYTNTPWCRILFEKLIVTQFVKKYPAFLRNPKVHHRVHKGPPLDPILSQPNPVRPLDPYLPKVHLNVENIYIVGNQAHDQAQRLSAYSLRQSHLMNIAFVCLTLLHIKEVPSSILGLEAAILTEVFRGFL